MEPIMVEHGLYITGVNVDIDLVMLARPGQVIEVDPRDITYRHPRVWLEPIGDEE